MKLWDDVDFKEFVETYLRVIQDFQKMDDRLRVYAEALRVTLLAYPGQEAEITMDLARFMMSGGVKANVLASMISIAFVQGYTLGSVAGKEGTSGEVGHSAGESGASKG